MNRLYGPVFQTCYLTGDLDAELAYWTGTLGVGPFFVLPPRRFESLSYRGQATDERDIIAGVALAFSGDMQIEIIVPGPAPSIYRDFLAGGGRGVHHLGIAAHDYDRQRRIAIDAGVPIVMEGASTLARFAYLEPDPARPGTILELIEMNATIAGVFDRIRTAARDWDGREAVRAL